MYRAKATRNNHLVLAPAHPGPELKRVLDRLVARADKAALLKGDPVHLVHRFSDPNDREVAGIIVAMMAYGRVASIVQKAALVLDVLGPHPACAITDPERLRGLSGFVHRFQSRQDLPRFLGAVARVRAEAGSLAAAFRGADDPAERTYVGAMARFVDRLTASVDGPLSGGLRFLLPQPRSGGAAKRLCLYLRWMIRPADGIDLGAWRELEGGFLPARLIVPLDTHIERIARYLGLTDRRSGGLATALEITERLRALAPEDPLVYDIALCHLGISGRCPSRRVIELCADCQLREVCRLGKEPKGWPWRPGSRRK